MSDVLPNDDFAQRDDSLIRWIRGIYPNEKIQSSQIKINIRTLFNLLAREMNLDKAEDMIRNVSFIFSQDFL